VTFRDFQLGNSIHLQLLHLLVIRRARAARGQCPLQVVCKMAGPTVIATLARDGHPLVESDQRVGPAGGAARAK
jgi:hypothetical protein